MPGASRRWGWHRLDHDWARRLVADSGLVEGALVLDVGAGTGAITAALLDVGARVIAVEAHPGRAAALRRTFGSSITVVRADAADLRLPRRPFHVVANPPFGITTSLLRRLLQPGSRLVGARLVLQEQAARRWTGPAAPGRGRWGAHFELTAGGRVPRRAFHPVPRIDARVVRIAPRRSVSGPRRTGRLRP